jgi:NitT/TauT family transport system substrate-binding protein
MFRLAPKNAITGSCVMAGRTSMWQSWLQTACGWAVTAAMLLSTEPGRAAEDVSIGITNAASDIVLFIADAKGFFKSEDIKPDFIEFDSAAKMIAPLGAGQLDVGGGAASSGLYNAIERGIGLRIVADKARNAPGFGFQSLLVRKALVTDGSVKTIADLRGRKIAIVAQASSDASVLNEALKSAGLGFDDVDKVYLGFPQQLAAYQNGAIDASITTEPTVTVILDASTAVRLVSNDQFYPNAQTAVILYGQAFSEGRRQVANGFMKAYVRAIRYYNDALSNGRIAAANADEIIAIMANYSAIKDPDLIRRMTAHSVDPNGVVNFESLKKDWTFFKNQHQISGKVTVDQVVDPTFAQAAVRSLGPYRSAR